MPSHPCLAAAASATRRSPALIKHDDQVNTEPTLKRRGEFCASLKAPIALAWYLVGVEHRLRSRNDAFGWVGGGAYGFLAAAFYVPMLRSVFHFVAVILRDLAFCIGVPPGQEFG